jgi:hypothetical protein
MESNRAKQLYRARAGICELPNAHRKCRHGAAEVLVHGTEKVTSVALLVALAANLLAHTTTLLA